MSFAGTDAPEIYARLRQQLVPQLQALTPDQAAVPVPSCPGWTVTNVMAHVSGLVAETLAGVPLPRGSDQATARQVADRSGLSLVEICQEWSANAPAFAAFGEGDPSYVAALASDLVVHALDIGEALDVAFDIDSVATQLVATRYGQALLERAADAGTPLTLMLDGAAIGPTGAVSDGLTLQASSLDFLRAVTGRRSRSDVRAMQWTGDPDPLLDLAWSQYGPFANE